jgi:hypothetical protein
MIGKYTILDVEGEDLSLNELISHRIAVIDDYRGKLGVSIIDSLTKFEGDETIIIHDLHGYFRVIKDDVLRVYAGLDIKFPSLKRIVFPLEIVSISNIISRYKPVNVFPRSHFP